MQVKSIIDRHQPAFAASGCQLSLQRAQQSHWVQVDVNPAMAAGQPGGCCWCWETGRVRISRRGVLWFAIAHPMTATTWQRTCTCMATLSVTGLLPVHVSCLCVLRRCSASWRIPHGATEARV
jgi:hypothetical protein